MEKEIDKELDGFVGRLLRETPMESPSLNFTSKIMARVETVTPNELFIYRPLISKHVWGGIALVLFIGCLLAIFGNFEMEYPLLSFMGIDRPNFDLFTNLSLFSMPNTLIYGVLGFSFFACIQIVLIKYQFDKRFMVH
ncbi:hypothetical protein [uncultured Kriegella sp.]|uniref:hypothetical protein n=1 Tax=uncultured Kriegella sp. TaxID=1798910 RepID=UPI0030D732FF|tara:strand:+ start:19137 stop:19550 length:414 start_codon:yes stop_codon:yes gene_type:complete